MIGALYQSPGIPLEEDDLDMLIGLPKSREFKSRGDLNSKYMVWNSRFTMSRGRKLAQHADRNNCKISAPDSLTYYYNWININLDLHDVFLDYL